MINSLRLTGNNGHVTVLDRGLTQAQRELLGRHAEIVDPSPELLGQHSWSLKPYPVLLDPQDVVVVIDSDMIVTRNLGHILGLAEQGKICVFPDPDEHRRFAEWQDLCGLQHPPRHQRYMNAGFVALSAKRWGELLLRWWTLSSQLPAEPPLPLKNRDQDVLNALLMSEVPPEAIAEQPREEAAYPWHQVKVRDSGSLACTSGEHPITLLHYGGPGPKPWDRRAWLKVRRDGYVRLMPRVLFGADVPLALAPKAVPVWLRPGTLGTACLRVLSGMNATGSRAASYLPTVVRRPLARRRHTR